MRKTRKTKKSYQEATASDKKAYLEAIAPGIRHWGICPLCQGVNTMLDYGRDLYCQACDRWLAKWVVKMENKPENQSTATAGGGAIRKNIYMGGEEVQNQDTST